METQQHHIPGTHGLSKPRKIAIVFALSLALCIIVLDTTLLNVLLATIIREFHTDIQSIQWVITAYSLTLAALTITGGRIGDLFGRKKMFVLGAIIFAIGSFITSISTNIPTMIIGESIIEGIGAALMMPATASLLTSNFVGHERAVAFGVWGGVAGAASALGPILGGFLATYYSWRWGFRINVFIALLLCLGSFIIPDSRDKEEKPQLDILGVILCGLGLLIFVFGIIESSTYGWWTASMPFTLGNTAYDFPFNLSIVPYSILVGALLLIAFIFWESVREQRKKTPLVSLKLFKNRQYTSGVLTMAVLALSMSGITFSIPVFFQSVRNYDALQTGTALLPLSLVLLVTAPVGANLAKKVSPKLIIQIGLFVILCASLLLRFLLNIDSTTWSLAPGLCLFGFGMGLVFSQVTNITLSAVSVQQAGEASGVNNTMRNIGQSLGTAIIGAVLLSALSTNLSNGIAQSSKIPNTIKPQITQAVSNQSSNVEFAGGAKFTNKLPSQISDEIVKISHEATVDAGRSALTVGLFFAILGFLTSFIVPNIPTVKKVEANKPAA